MLILALATPVVTTALSLPSARAAQPAAPASVPDDVRGASLSAFVEKLGRAPDASEDGGACGGIMIHDWHAEGLRVISQGDRVQQVSRIPAQAD